MKIYLTEPRPATSGYEPALTCYNLVEEKGKTPQITIDYFCNIASKSKYIKNAFDKILELSTIRDPGDWEDRKYKEMPKIGGVYFIQNGNLEQIKIGWSSNPLKRKESLQTGNPNRLKIHGVQPALDKGLEHYLHKKFKKYSIDPRGEWFRFSEEIKNYIQNSGHVFPLEKEYYL